MKSCIATLLFWVCAFVALTPVYAVSTNSYVDVNVSVNGKTIVGNAAKILQPEQISSYDVSVIINKDGSMDVVERILYNFPKARHGIVRTIPYVKTNDEGKRLKMTFDAISVVDEKKRAYDYTVSYNGSDIVLKIGDPNETIVGEHVYSISYNVKGAFTYFEGHDELYWNALGQQWNVPVQSASVRVLVPSEILPTDIQTKCFMGVVGSTDDDCSSSIEEMTISYKSSRALGAYEGMTIVVGFPKGIIKEVNPIEIVPFFDTKIGKIVLFILFIVAIFWYVLLPLYIVWKWWTGGRDPKPLIGQAVAWYSPPKTKQGRELTPAETGTLIDERVDLKDIYGSIVDLARRGFMTIIETSKNSFDLEKKKEWKGVSLEPFEEKLLSVLFGTKNRVTLKDIKLYESISELHTLIYKSLVRNGFFPVNPQSIRTKYVILLIFAVITFNPILVLVSWMFGMSMPKKTLFGSEQAAIARSLKNFLKSQDKHLAFQAKEKFMFEKLLPYAIVFGVEAIWAKRFNNIKMTPPDWYVSTTPRSHFSSIVIANSLHTGYGVSFASSVQYKSSSGYSSGFRSGGGFSGGGGGGGGGGSW